MPKRMTQSLMFYPLPYEADHGRVGMRMPNDIAVNQISVAGQWRTPGDRVDAEILGVWLDGVEVEAIEPELDNTICNLRDDRIVALDKGQTLEIEARCPGADWLSITLTGMENREIED